MLKEASREINGKVYTVQSLPAMPGRSILVKLFKLIGPTCAQALRGKTSLKEIRLDTLTGDDLANMVLELSERVTEHEFEAIVVDFMKYTQVNEPGVTKGPVSLVKEFAFTADYGSMFKWLAFCIEHNYASFLADLGLTVRQG